MRQKKSIVIVVSEGIKTVNGNYLCEENNEKRMRDAFGHASLGGPALYLTSFLRSQMGIKTRENILGTQQRSASHIVSRNSSDKIIKDAHKITLDKLILFLCIHNEM